METTQANRPTVDSAAIAAAAAAAATKEAAAATATANRLVGDGVAVAASTSALGSAQPSAPAARAASSGDGTGSGSSPDATTSTNSAATTTCNDASSSAALSSTSARPSVDTTRSSGSAAVAAAAAVSTNANAGSPIGGRQLSSGGSPRKQRGQPRGRRVSSGPAVTGSPAGVAVAAPPPSDVPLWTMPNPTTEEELKAAIEEIRGHPNLPTPPVPVAPKFDSRTSVKQRVKKLQQYISSFEYNHTGTRYFPVHKDKGQLKLTDTAKQIMREALPIQCLEAVMLGCFLTTKWPGVDRVPISFKSFVKPINRSFRHIVMAIRFQGKWGAIGLSRKDTLMYKKVKFPSLSALIKDYQAAYENCWHVLKKVYVGFPFRHEPMSVAPIKWRVLNLRVDKHPWEEVADSLDTYAKDLAKLADYYHLHKRLPDSFNSTYVFKKSAVMRVAAYPPGASLGSPKSNAGTPRCGNSSNSVGRGTPKARDSGGGGTGDGRRAAATAEVEDPNASSDDEVVPAPPMATKNGGRRGKGSKKAAAGRGKAQQAAEAKGANALDGTASVVAAAAGAGAEAGAAGGAGALSATIAAGAAGSAPPSTAAGGTKSGGDGEDGDDGEYEDDEYDEDGDEDQIAEAPKVSSAHINQAFLAV